MRNPARLATEEYCYLTTTGRTTTNPHEIEIWFALRGSTLYVLSGDRDRADWVKNLRRDPRVTVRINGETLRGRAREPTDDREDDLARRLLVEKYERVPGRLANWRRNSLPVAVDLDRGWAEAREAPA